MGMDGNPLEKLMFPRSVAFMGASNNIMRMGSFLLVNLIGGKFEGPVYPVHPSEETVLGLKAYRKLEDLPEVPDLLVLVIPTGLVPDILEEAGSMGIDRAIIVSVSTMPSSVSTRRPFRITCRRARLGCCPRAVRT
jgi:acyl-CoA synthetase (NDP forming)